MRLAGPAENFKVTRDRLLEGWSLNASLPQLYEESYLPNQQCARSWGRRRRGRGDQIHEPWRIDNTSMIQK